MNPGASGVGSASVIIPTKNRAMDLEKTIASLERQTKPPKEVIVIDQSLSPSFTRATGLFLRLLHRPELNGAAEARNVGMDDSTGDVLVFLDDDVELEPAFLEELLAAYQPGVTGVQGIITNYKKYPLGLRLWEKLFARGIFEDKRQQIYWNADKLLQSSPIPVDRFTGALMSFRADAVKNVRWNTLLTGGSFQPQDDLDFCWSIPGRPVLLLNPRARLAHNRTPTERNAAHWLSIHANVNYFMWRKHWSNLPRQVPNFLWLSIGYVLVAGVSCLKRRSFQPWRAWTEGARKGSALAVRGGV